MWIQSVTAVSLLVVACGHPHHHHLSSRSHEVQKHSCYVSGRNKHCCQVPALIEQEALEEAEFEGPLIPAEHPCHGPNQHTRPLPSNDNGPTHHHGLPPYPELDFRRHGRPRDSPTFSCEKEKCLFSKLGWLTDNTTLNTESITGYFSEWSSTYEVWSSTKDLVLQQCLNPHEDEHAPPGRCVEITTIFCLLKKFFNNCPSAAWTASKYCENLKEARRPSFHALAECCALPDIADKTKLSECGMDSLLPPSPPSSRGGWPHHHSHLPPHQDGHPPLDHFGLPPPEHYGPPPPEHHGPPLPEHHGHPHHGRRGPSYGVGPGRQELECDHHWELFEKYGWLTENRTLKSEAYAEHLTIWSTKHQTWTGVKEKVIDLCVQNQPDSMCPGMCLPRRILICTQRVMAENCADSSWKTALICQGGPQQTLHRSKPEAPTTDASNTDPSSSDASKSDPTNTNTNQSNTEVSNSDASNSDLSNSDKPEANQDESVIETTSEVIVEAPDSQVENIDVE